MNYSAITNSLIVGDYKTAQDLTTLRKLGVSHVVACGFEKGHFPDRFVYFPVNILDTPTSNLLSYLPRVVKFIRQALEEDGVVYVHCVHGQSRSCSVCIAYLIDQHMMIDPNSENLLHNCYNLVKIARPCMAVNPGFVQQLELFRRMLLFQKTQKQRESIERGTFLQSSAHAAFRVFRAKMQFYHRGNITKFCPLDLSSCRQVYLCKGCNETLLTDNNIVLNLSDREISFLPASDYWINSHGGKDYTMLVNKSNYCNDAITRILKNADNAVKSEPMEWMRQNMNASIGGNTCRSRGILICPGRCAQDIGYFDLCHPDPVTSVVLIRSKMYARMNSSLQLTSRKPII